MEMHDFRYSRFNDSIIALDAIQNHYGYALLAILVVVAVFGNALVILAVLIDRKLRSMATNKLIAGLAVSDLLVGFMVIPLAVYYKVHNDTWDLGSGACRFYLMSSTLVTSASILHLVAISVDRYFAIMFPTEYQRHSIQTATVPYIVVIWIISALLSASILLEMPVHQDICWLEDPQYLVLSSLMAFILPASAMIYMYFKIFVRLRKHSTLFGHMRKRNNGAGWKNNIPQVIIEEVKSRRGSSRSIFGSRRGSNASQQSNSDSKGRSISHPDIAHLSEVVMKQFRSPSICTDNPRNEKTTSLAKLIAPAPDPPSVGPTPVRSHTFTLPEISEESNTSGQSQNRNDNKSEDNETTTVTVHNHNKESPRTPDLKPTTLNGMVETNLTKSLLSPTLSNSNQSTPTLPVTLSVPMFSFQVTNSAQPGSTGRQRLDSESTLSVTNSDDPDRRSSMLSFGSSLSDSTLDSNSRRSSRMESIASISKHNSPSKLIVPSGSDGDENTTQTNEGNSRDNGVAVRKSSRLRRIANRVTRAIRRKKKESQALRREKRATRVVAAIMGLFVVCWLPYFISCIYRGICGGIKNCSIDRSFHASWSIVTSLLGYSHSCLNPIIYTCLNRNFRATFKSILGCKSCAKDIRKLSILSKREIW